MSLEANVKDVISKKLEDGTIEKIIQEQMEKGVTNAMENLFRSYGDVTKVIESKVKEVMVPYIERHNFSEYLTKLDQVLIEVLEHSALENKKLLENFKDIMVNYEEDEKQVTASALFKKYQKYVAAKCDTDDLEICYDDGVSYEPVEVSMEFEEDNRSWSSFKDAKLIFECEKDESLNVVIPLSQWTGSYRFDEKKWDIRFQRPSDLSSLRHLNSFEVYLMALSQNFTNIIIDESYETDEVYLDAEPEPDFR